MRTLIAGPSVQCIECGAQGVYARGLCVKCYKADRWNRRDEISAANRLPEPPKDLKSVLARARYYIEHAISEPIYLAKLLKRFRDRSLSDDKVMMEVISRIYPKAEVGGGFNQVQVVINAPTLTEKDTNKTYDVTGEVIEAEKA